MNPIIKRQKYAIFAGTVVMARKSQKNHKEKYAIIIRDYKGNVGEFWFSSVEEIEKAKIKANEFIIIKALSEPFEESSYTAFQVCRKGRLTISGNDNVASVIIGPAFSPRAPKEDMFTLSMPLAEKQEDGTYADTWYTVSFFNGSKDDANASNGRREWRNAEYAAKVMGNRERAKVAIVVGKPQHHVYNDKMYHTFVGTTMIRASN